MIKPVKSHKKSADKNRRQDRAWPQEKKNNEVDLSQEPPEDFRDTEEQWEKPQADTSANLSRPEDRGEDLINETDPFMQQPERDTQIPPELIQRRAYSLYEQRGGNPGDDVSDWFEAERQLRREKHIF